MLRIAGYEFNGTLNYVQGGQYAEVIVYIDPSAKLNDDDIEKIKSAKVIEEVFIEYEETITHVGTYSLYGWRKIEKDNDGTYRISWQTSRETDVTELKEQLTKAKEENEMLSQAILELAQIIGGEEE